MRRESLSGRSSAVCRGENSWGLDKRFAVGSVFPAISFPALQKSRREIFRSRQCPAIDDGRRQKCASYDFTFVRREVA